MSSVDLKSLLEKLNDFSTSALHTAAGQAVNRTHYEVSLEHFLLACLAEAQSDIPLALERFGVDQGRLEAALNATLEDFRSGNAGRPVFSPLLIDVLEAAWLIASVDLGLAQLRSGAILLAFLRKPAVYAQGSYTELLAAINRDELLRGFGQLAATSKESTMTLPSGKGESKGLGASGGEGFIAKFCEDFTAKAQAGKIDPVFGRDEEIRQMVDILARRRKNNPILVGEPGVGKTAVLEGLALRIVEGDVPETLAGVTLLSLDMGLLEAGAGMKGEFERRLKGVLDEIKASEKPIVLFIDEAHMLVGAGGAAGGSDAANLMKPALARGEIRTCAATTWKEYKKYFEKDPALARRFQLVKLDEPSVETAVLILRGIRASYEKAHGVLVRDDALEAAASLAHRYIQGRFLPDKAIDLLDTACARVKVSLAAKPAPLEDKVRAMQAAEREFKGLKRDLKKGVAVDAERFNELESRITRLNSEVESLQTAWQEEKAAAEEYIRTREAMLAASGLSETGETLESESAALNTEPENTPEAEAASAAFEAAKNKLEALREKQGGLIYVEVSKDVVAQVVANWTGIPVGRMAQEQAAVTRDLDRLLGERIKGQDMALAAITKGIQAASAGLRAPNQPLGVFLLVGPSGVGKTETGITLAELLFGDAESIVSINMSEFQEKHTVSRLIGSPPGYVGYGEGGMLTEAVRRRPYSVVLLDEVEKAHLDVLNLFYQVFDKGTLTDGEGKEVSFRNTIILLTSNLASDLIQEATAGDSGEDMDMDTLTGLIRPVLSEHFRPALLARMSIVPYRSLAASALGRIADLKLQALVKRLKENKGMALTYTSAVVDQIVARCSETETGARNIEYILAGAVLPRLAASILEHMSDSAMPTAVTLDVGEDGAFTMQFS